MTRKTVRVRIRPPISRRARFVGVFGGVEGDEESEAGRNGKTREEKTGRFPPAAGFGTDSRRRHRDVRLSVLYEPFAY